MQGDPWNDTKAQDSALGQGTDAEEPLVLYAAATGSGRQPLSEALQCLREAGVPFALLHADPENPDAAAQLDILIDAPEVRIASAALRRAGFREMRGQTQPPGTTLFLLQERDRFHALALHLQLVALGLRYMDARLALARADRSGAYPRLCSEDRFLALLMRSLLEKSHVAEDVRVQLRLLRREGLSVDKMAEQMRPFGLELVARRVLRELDLLLQNRRRWAGLRCRVAVALVRAPGNVSGAWQYLRENVLRFSFQPVVLAVLGPPGAGKTAFCAALSRRLAGSTLQASRLSMSCWEMDGLTGSLLRRLVPGRISFWRLFLVRCGRPQRLSEEERQLLETALPGHVPLALLVGGHALRSMAFHLLVGLRLALRYLRGVARSRSPLVIADGWIYDLGLRFGREAFVYGHGLQLRIIQHFPRPDGILYLSERYDSALTGKPEVDAETFTRVNKSLRQLLKPLGPLELVHEASPDETARTFLRRYWAHLLERHNRHA